MSNNLYEASLEVLKSQIVEISNGLKGAKTSRSARALERIEKAYSTIRSASLTYFKSHYHPSDRQLAWAVRAASAPLSDAVEVPVDYPDALERTADALEDLARRFNR